MHFLLKKFLFFAACYLSEHFPLLLWYNPQGDWEGMFWNQAFIFRSYIGANWEVAKVALPEKKLKQKKSNHMNLMSMGSNFYLTFMCKKSKKNQILHKKDKCVYFLHKCMTTSKIDVIILKWVVLVKLRLKCQHYYRLVLWIGKWVEPKELTPFFRKHCWSGWSNFR